jgi:hypothetical protein
MPKFDRGQHGGWTDPDLGISSSNDHRWESVSNITIRVFPVMRSSKTQQENEASIEGGPKIATYSRRLVDEPRNLGVHLLADPERPRDVGDVTAEI